MEKKPRISSANYLLILKSFVLGVLFSEVFALIKIVGEVFIEVSISTGKDDWFWLICISYAMLIISYLFRDDFWKRTYIIFKSLRFDLLLVLFFGALLIFSFGGLGTELVKHWVTPLTQFQLTVFTSLPLIIYISPILRNVQGQYLIKKKEQDSFFMSDKEGNNKNDDQFGFLSNAERFAERVFNQGASDSLVFGIDAPWGTGKSTFVNLCKEYWDEKYKDEMIIYTFDPLRYESKENLLEKFLDAFISEIRKHVFAPEIESLISKYSKLLKKSKTTISIFGIRFGVPSSGNESMDDVFERLERALENIDKKIVIIIDDLDRLDFSTIKEILFVIKRVFTLPNISYVLCYDTENMTKLEQKNEDSEKVAEFLEKFINVKTSVYLDNELLLQYFTESKYKSLSNNPLVDTLLISKAVDGLNDIFSSRDFHFYVPFIGDARKLKRLINTIILLEVEKIDFENCDFDKQDLIHLLLIYINYPNVFRKIYNTETNGKRGFFSVVTKYDEGYPESDSDEDYYKNSSEYTNYLKDLSDNQKFILNKVFDVNQRLVDSSKNILAIKRINKEISTSYACFNGSRLSSIGRNLEQYLNLISKMSRPLVTEQYKFYVKCKNNILSGKTIEEVFSSLERENQHDQLWRVLMNTSRNEFTSEKSKEVIYYALDVAPKYSHLKIESIGVGLRDLLPYYIAKLLNEIGWSDEVGKHQNNTDENVSRIAEWIFGEGSFVGEGVLDILGSHNRGVLGLYDLLLFRLNCCIDRGGDIYNLARSLSKHVNSNAQITGDTKVTVIEEMREISQMVFRIFQSQYIDRGRNVFDEIDNLTMENICGKYFNYTYINGDIEDIDVKINRLKSGIKSFIVYQLGNSLIYLGIGCGYYDVNGNNDEKGISEAINEYLFEYCFNPEYQENNYKHFLDYLLMNFSHAYGERGKYEFRPNFNEFTKALNIDKLTNYWEKHRNVIRTKKFESEERKVFTNNYVASYDLDLLDTYDFLDTLIRRKINSQRVS